MTPTPLRGGLPGVTLRSSLGYTVDVYTHGAHVTSWKDKDGTDMLFCSSEARRARTIDRSLSPRTLSAAPRSIERRRRRLSLPSPQAVFKPPKAIRGGIPICFPQFSDFGPLGQHGFARNATWEVRATDRDVSPRPAGPFELRFLRTNNPPSSGAQVHSRETDKIILRLSDTPETLALWPHKFTVLYEVFADGKSLRTSMAVSNDGIEIDLENDENDPALPGGGGIRLGGRPMTFTAALHTYFSVTDITRATVTGLRNVEYLDSLRQRQKFTETSASFLSVPFRVVASPPRTTYRHVFGFSAERRLTTLSSSSSSSSSASISQPTSYTSRRKSIASTSTPRTRSSWTTPSARRR